MELWRQNPNLHRLDELRHLVSGSQWTMHHVNAFRVLIDINTSILPDHYSPSDEIISRYRLFWAMSRDDVYNAEWDVFYSQAGDTPPNFIAGITSCMDAIVDIVDRRNSHDSDLSHTTNEDENELEIATSALARVICRTFLNLSGLHRKTRPSWDFVTKNREATIRILRSIEGTVRNDGSIVYVDQHRRIHPRIWIETKPLEYAPRSIHYEKTIPQKVAETLTLAQNNCDYLNNIIHDQDVFGIEFSHRYASIWHAIIPASYLIRMYNEPVLSPDDNIVMKRSHVYDLAEPDHRKHFAELFLAVLNYIDPD